MNFFDQFDQPAAAPVPMAAPVTAPVAAAPPVAAPVNFFDQFDAAPAPPVEAPSVSADVAKSGGIGLAKGVIGLAGLPGDISELGARGIDRATQYVGGKLGVDVKPRADAAPTYGSADIQKGVEGVTGEFYKPKTTAGEFAQTAGEFAPGLIGGPETVLAKLATRVVAPAIASEAAGQLTKGTAAEPFARVAAAVAGGMGGARALRPAPAAIPAADEIRDASRAAYAEVRNLGLEIHPGPVSTVAHGIENDLTNLGLTARNVPETYGAIRTLQNPPPGSVMRATDFENARQELVQAANNPTNRREAVAARTAINHLDNYLANIPAADVIRGDAARASELFRDARANWAAASRADTVGGKIELGDLNAATANSGQNIDNATRQAVKQLIRPDKNGRTMAEKMGFNDEEIAQMNHVARGTFTGNLARFGSHLFGGGGGLGAFLTAGAGGLAAGPAGVALPALGFALKGVSNRSTANQAAILDALVRSRSPAARQAAAAAPIPQLSNPIQQGAISAALTQPFGALAPMLRP